MDAPARRPHHPPVHVLPHIKRLDDALGDFLVRVTCVNDVRSAGEAGCVLACGKR
jgi:hypothetical protein